MPALSWTPEDDEHALRDTPVMCAINDPEQRTADAWRARRWRVQNKRALARMTTQADQEVGLLDVKPPPTDEDYEAFFASLESADGMKDVLSPTQETATFYPPEDGLPIGITFTGDWHCGASGVLYAQLKADLETIRDTEGLYAIGMGDFLEGVSTHSKAAPALYSGLFNEGGFQEKYVVMRASLAKGKWLAIMSGNHDEWLYKNAGITRTDQLAATLAAPYFPQGGGTLFVETGNHRYVIAVRHNGKGNSQINPSNAQRRTFDEWPQWDNCDVITLAHLHYNDLHVSSRKGRRCTYLRSGSYKVHDAYARDGGFSPEWGLPLVILYPDERRVLAFRGDDFATGVRFLQWERERMKG